MSKKLKIILGLSSGVFVLLLGLLFLVNVVYEPEPEKLIYPAGELSDSIFVGQNNNYTKNSGLGKTHTFETVPYRVDVPESQGANIGSGCVYEVGGGMFVYVTEFDDMTQVEEGHYDKVVQMQDILASQFPAALLINYIPEETRITAEASGSGFINGFTAHYLADSIGITDGAQQVNSGLMGYILDVDKKGFEGRHMYVAVGTKDPTNESLQNGAAVLSAIMQTVRFDEKMYQEMTAGMNLDEDTEQLADSSEEDGEGMPVDDADVIDTASAPEEDVFEKRIYSDQDDAQLQVNVSWENENYDVILELFLPGEAEFCEPLNQSGTSAQFVLANAPSGEYVLRMKNYRACGEIGSGSESVGDSGSYDSDDSYDPDSSTDTNGMGFLKKNSDSEDGDSASSYN